MVRHPRLPGVNDGVATAGTMKSKHVVFVSAVSREFHAAPPELRYRFQSYRDTMRQAFRALAPHYEVLVQEDLVQGVGDLLETLDREVARSLVVIHLVGDTAGDAPAPAALRRLQHRYPDFLSTEPELAHSLLDGSTVSYTQWELYLAYHHQRHRLVFKAAPTAPRSPYCEPTVADGASQERHWQRLQITAAHYGTFADQGDVARKTMRAFLHFRLDASVDGDEPAQDAVDAAWAAEEQIVTELAAAIRNPDPRTVPFEDPANVVAFVAAVRAIAARRRVNLATVLAIAAHHEDTVRAAAEGKPTPDTLYRQAFAELALGDFTAAHHTARRAAARALHLRREQPEDDGRHRESAVSALLLAHEAAVAARDVTAAGAALRDAAELADRQATPLMWADVHEQLARFLVDHDGCQEASELVSEIVDIREDLQGEAHRELARTLLLWCEILFLQAKYSGSVSVAARAERICASDPTTNAQGIAASLNAQAVALRELGDSARAASLLRRALAIQESSLGPDHGHVAPTLNNLATVLRTTNQLVEAEALGRRALAIAEASSGPDHPTVATAVTNLAAVLEAANQLGEAEALLRRALAIGEANAGGHSRAAKALTGLAAVLRNTGRTAEAEALIRRALTIVETRLGPDHPEVARVLNYLAGVLQDRDLLADAEPLLRRALTIEETSLGRNHPKLAATLNNLGRVLGATNRLRDAELLLRRALAIQEASDGHDAPCLIAVLNNLGWVLQASSRFTEAELIQRRAVAVAEASHDANHPSVGIALGHLALLLRATNQLAEAERLLRRALSIIEASYGVHHPDVGTVLQHLAQLLRDTHRPAEADVLLRRAAGIEKGSRSSEV
jgi:tetratricopeptide (TPR) repeat protein